MASDRAVNLVVDIADALNDVVDIVADRSDVYAAFERVANLLDEEFAK